MGRMRIDRRDRVVEVDAATVFRQVERIGGDTGYYFADWIWRIRGLVDRIFGGPGFTRQRRDPDHLEAGEVFDCWRVARVEADACLRLESAMKMPGEGVLQFEVQSTPTGSILRQMAAFEPHGLAGLAYWYLLYPIHLVIWEGMLRQIAGAAEAEAENSVQTPVTVPMARG